MISSIRPVFILISLSGFAQLVPVFGIPVLSRVYRIEHFGLFGLFNSILILIGTIGCLRLEQLLYSQNKDERLNTARCAISLAIYFALPASLLAGFLFNMYLHIHLSIICLSVSTVLYSISIVLVALSSLEGRFSPVGISLLLKNVVMLTVQFLWTYIVPFDGEGLMIGVTAGCLLQTFYLSRQISMPVFYPVSLVVLKKTVCKNWGFLGKACMQSGANTLSSNLPVFFISYLYGAVVLGYYSMAIRILSVPINFIGNSIRPFILKKLGELLPEKVKKVRWVLGLPVVFSFLSLVIFLPLIYYFSGDVLMFFLGSDWVGLDTYLAILSVWMIVAFFNVPAVSYFTVIRKMGMLAVYDLTLLISRLLVFLCAVQLIIEISYCLLLFSIIGGFFNLILMWYAYIHSGRNREKTLFGI